MKGKLIYDKYLVLKTLGRSKFSETFLASDKNRFSVRRYTIKKFRPILGNPHAQEIKRLFQHEAHVLKRLNGENPQIPQLYEFFTDGEDFYIVREWIRGTTLEQRVQQQGILSEPEVKQILDSILKVLKYIHSNNLVYHQLKPSSILLRQQNWLPSIKKQDHLPVPIYFGGANELETKKSQLYQETPVLAHQREYTAPEQEQGESIYASDLYSLGLTAIYLLTGKTPGELETDSFSNKLLWQHQAIDLKSNLARVIDRAISSNPQARFTSAESMLQALHSQPVFISEAVIYKPVQKSWLTSETKIIFLLFTLGLGVLGIIFSLLNPDLPRLAIPSQLDSATNSKIEENAAKTFTTSTSKQPIQTPDIPTFSVGVDQDLVIDSLGTPSMISKGYWGNSRAFSYTDKDLATEQIGLGYLSDLETNQIRQTEIYFDPSVELKAIHATVQELLLSEYSSEVENQINQIFFRTSREQQLELKNLEMIIQRNSLDRIYIGIWDKDFH